MKAKVDRTVGVYERPRKPWWPRIVLVLVALLLAWAGVHFFGDARASDALEGSGAERVAGAGPAGFQAALEPAHALRGAAVRERLGHHPPLGLLL